MLCSLTCFSYVNKVFSNSSHKNHSHFPFSSPAAIFPIFYSFPRRYYQINVECSIFVCFLWSILFLLLTRQTFRDTKINKFCRKLVNWYHLNLLLPHLKSFFIKFRKESLRNKNIIYENIGNNSQFIAYMSPP